MDMHGEQAHAWQTRSRSRDDGRRGRLFAHGALAETLTACTAGYLVIRARLSAETRVRRFVGGENPARLYRLFTRRAARVSRLSLLARCIRHSSRILARCDHLVLRFRGIETNDRS